MDSLLAVPPPTPDEDKVTLIVRRCPDADADIVSESGVLSDSLADLVLVENTSQPSPAHFTAGREVLSASSSYFRSLFSHFKEAKQESVIVYWDPTIFAKVLSFLYGEDLDMGFRDILPMIQSAYMFGIDTLLERCREWISNCSPEPGGERGPVVDLDSASDLWAAAKEVARDAAEAHLVAELCVITLAVFFEDAVAQHVLKEVPQELLLDVVNNEHLTVQSEKVVCQALLEWAQDAGADVWTLVSKVGWAATSASAQEIRWPVLPLPFLLGLPPSALPLGSVRDSAVRLASQPRAFASSPKLPVVSKEFLPRLSPFSKVLDLADCQQFNEASFSALFQHSWPNLTSLDVSNCWRLTHPAFLYHLADLLPNLRCLTAANCPEMPWDLFTTEGHPSLRSLDLSLSSGQQACMMNRPRMLGLQPAPGSFSSRLFSSAEIGESFQHRNLELSNSHATGLSQPRLQHAPKKTISQSYPCLITVSLRNRGGEGSALLGFLGSFCRSLTSLDVSGCPKVTDGGLAPLIGKLPWLEELRAAGTEFGPECVAALLGRERLFLWDSLPAEVQTTSGELCSKGFGVSQSSKAGLASSNTSGTESREEPLLATEHPPLLTREPSLHYQALLQPKASAKRHNSGMQERHTRQMEKERCREALRCQLRVLDVSHCKSLSKDQIIALVCGLTGLEEVSLAVTAAEGIRVPFASSGLQRLNLNGLIQISSGLVASLERNWALRWLDIRGCRPAVADRDEQCPLSSRHGAGRSANSESLQQGGVQSTMDQQLQLESASGSSVYESASGVQEESPSSGQLAGLMLAVRGLESKLEVLKMGWGFLHGSFHLMGPALQGLRSLTLGLGAVVSDADLAKIPGVCPQLEHLRLRLLMISEDGILPLVHHVRHLKTLSLHRCAGPFTSRLAQALSAAPSSCSVRTLKLIGGIASLEDEDIAQLTRGLRSLEKLALSGARKLTPASLGIIAQGWPALRHLALETCGRAAADGADVLISTCRALKSLKLVHCGRGLPVDFLMAVRARLPMLTSLFVDGCDAVEGKFAVVKPTGEALPKHSPLQCVQISRCKRAKPAIRIIHAGDLDSYCALVRTAIDTVQI